MMEERQLLRVRAHKSLAPLGGRWGRGGRSGGTTTVIPAVT